MMLVTNLMSFGCTASVCIWKPFYKLNFEFWKKSFFWPNKVCLRFGNKILSLEGVDKHFMKLMIKFAW
jgi:hypothetical protein